MTEIDKSTLRQQIDGSRVPRHIAIIMDGNGRWAKARGEERAMGHVAGVEAVRRAIEAASEIGVEYLTLYAFSTENWNRPKEEVDALLHLIVTGLKKETPGMVRNNVQLGVIGDIDRLTAESRASLDESIAATSACTGLKVYLALSYSSRWEIARAARLIADEVARGLISADDVDEMTVARHLATAGIPDPDLLIRTGGDERVSNFLLWQIAYSELVFIDSFWPDFTHETLYAAVLRYQKRERRYGLTSEQVTGGADEPDVVWKK